MIDGALDQKIETNAGLLGIDKTTFIKNAIEYYLGVTSDIIYRQGKDESNLTKFSYDEFWDGLDIG